MSRGAVSRWPRCLLAGADEVGVQAGRSMVLARYVQIHGATREPTQVPLNLPATDLIESLPTHC
ncbi:hypothetical protein SGPA1_31566 [Streptomyces misionensis JCM 4497]